MSWKEVLKLDRAKLRRREKESRRKIDESNLPEDDKKHMRSALGQDLNAEEQNALDRRAEKRREMGLKPAGRLMGSGKPRSKRIHRMKPEDKPKPRRRATEEELRELTRRNKPPKMGSKGSGFRGH